jgi:2-dehydropantoate 2-reductase
MRIAVIGAGAMGSIISYLLSENNEVILFENRPERLEEISTNGVRLKGDLRGEAFIPIQSPGPPAEPFDLVVLAVSAVASLEALRPVSPFVHRETIYLSFQEGSALDELVEIVGEERAVACLPIVSAIELNGGEVEVEKLHSIIIGGYNRDATGHLQPFADALAASGIPFEMERDMELAIWDRVRSAAPVSALCGILGGVPEEIRGLEEVDAICREAASEWIIEVERPEDVLPLPAWEEAVWRWATPPLLRDIEAGRKTEIEFLGGRLLKTTARDRSMPVNRSLVSLIKEVQSGSLTPGEGAWNELRRRVAEEKGMGLS